MGKEEIHYRTQIWYKTSWTA